MQSGAHRGSYCRDPKASPAPRSAAAHLGIEAAQPFALVPRRHSVACRAGRSAPAPVLSCSLASLPRLQVMQQAIKQSAPGIPAPQELLGSQGVTAHDGPVTGICTGGPRVVCPPDMSGRA
jgi:hypothetical protein